MKQAMLTVGLMALVIPTLATCSQGAAPYDYQAAVKRELRDPESAQFSEVTENVESACGFVNSKNGFGGYAGKQPFVAVGSTVRIIDGADKGDTDLVAARCQEPARAKIVQWMSNAAIDSLKR